MFFLHKITIFSNISPKNSLAKPAFSRMKLAAKELVQMKM